MIVFGLVELGKLGDFSYYGFFKTLRFVQLLFGPLSESLLFIIVIEDRRPVLWAAIDELPARVRWVHMSPEDVEQFFVGDFLGVKDHLNGFNMSRTTCRNLIVGGVLFMPARVPWYHLNHTFYFFKVCLRTPKTSTRKSGRVKFVDPLAQDVSLSLFFYYFFLLILKSNHKGCYQE